MNRHFMLAAVAGMLTIAVVGGLLYGVVFSGFFRDNIVDLSVMRSPPGFVWIALSHVPFGILLALAVSWRGVLSTRGGATTGAILGFLMAASYDLSQFGTLRHWTLQLTLVEPFIALIMVAVAGAVVGTVLSKSKAKVAAASASEIPP
jgi:uncharacterized membrane protein